MFLSTSLSLGCTQLIKDINSPAEWIIVSLVAVQLVKSLKFRVGDDKIFEKVRVASRLNIHICIPWKLLSIREGVTLLSSTEKPR